MPPTRRHLLAGLPATALLAALPARAADDPRMAQRGLGSPTAPLVVQEWFSLTCTHCAHFDQAVFPALEARLIETGRIRYVFADFPLDQVALTAAMLARSLPPERYLPFSEALLASQDRWAFVEGDPRVPLARMAELAGMTPDQAQAAMDDQALRAAIVTAQDAAQSRYGITGTPTFVFGSVVYGPVYDEASFDEGVRRGLAAAGGKGAARGGGS